ncbi:bile acid:sodium symporter family protein [Sphingomonas jatrophae]|uniref:Solute carrier family 10 (Sodium/bile acid cotransporter), member 7 n=1 Tax=Sphingomonas jatrophae TaxID=1166337 RepID=A0A1I6KZY2_9SPHN|nr:bile acid:sodium symporter family protein [Sphingomonas jatrophae]SFR96754.1 solute carrier family 10 (sodium/bile acid cotransporter), member 7 [Sphingomonas jatrophae]
MLNIVRRIDRYSLMLLGTVLVATVLPCRGSVADAFHLTTMAAIALLFFLHGAKLSRAAILAGMGNWRLHLVVLALTFAAFPVLGLAFHSLATWVVAPSLAAGMLFLTLLPSTVQSSIAFTAIARGNVPAAVCSASASNLIGIALTPLLVALLMDGGGSGGVSGAEVRMIALQLLLPFLLGHLSRPVTACTVERHKAVLSLVDRGSILLVVYTAFSAAVVEGLWSAVPGWQLAAIILLCAMLLTVVMVGATMIARRSGFSKPDEIAIVFCGSKKSLASGVPMAGVLFPAAQVGAIILPLMIFHQLQLLACAAIAQRYAGRSPDPERAADAVLAS